MFLHTFCILIIIAEGVASGCIFNTYCSKSQLSVESVIFVGFLVVLFIELFLRVNMYTPVQLFVRCTRSTSQRKRVTIQFHWNIHRLGNIKSYER